MEMLKETGQWKKHNSKQTERKLRSSDSNQADDLLTLLKHNIANNKEQMYKCSANAC
jgi:hypothetical protein